MSELESEQIPGKRKRKLKNRQRPEERVGAQYENIALRELRHARKLVEEAPAGTPIPEQASIAVGIANVLALLDLANAIRGQQAPPLGPSAADV
jgi:hypothetical protein